MASTDRVHLDPSVANNSNLFANGGDQINYDESLSNTQPNWPSADTSLAYGTQYGSSAFSQPWSQPANRPSSTNLAAQYSNTPQVFTNQFYSNNHNQLPFQATQATGSNFDSGLSASNFLEQQNSVTQQHQTPYRSVPSATISPAALQSSNISTGSFAGKQAQSQNQQIHSNYGLPPVIQAFDLSAPSSVTRPEPPSAVDEGQFFVIPYDALATATQSRRLHNFVNIGAMTQDMPLTKSTVPNYVPRKSFNELKQMATTNTQLAAKLTKDKAPKVSKILVPKVQANAKPSIAGNLVKMAGTKGDVDLVSLESSSEDESEYESSSDEEEAEPSPLPATRPQQPLEAARYDTIKAVWLPRNQFAKPDQIRVGLKDFWEVVKTIRDQWKSDNDAVKRAVDAKREGQIPMLKDRVKLQRDSLEMVMRATLEHGHNDIIRLCGENKPMMFALYQFLHACLKDNDYESSFIQTALKFLTRCSTLSIDILDATSLRKAVDRFAKRGTPIIKTLAQKVLDNAHHKKAQAAKQIAPSKPIDAKAKLALNASAKVNPSPEKSSTKRPLPVEGPSTSSVKRPAVAGSAGSTTIKPGMVSKKPLSSADKLTTPATSTVKTKTVVTKAPTHSLFASLNVPKRTPATIAAAKQRAAAAAAAEIQSKPVATASSSSIFSQLLTKTKDPVEEIKKPAEKNLPPETAEQKAKRIRKEERRKLRVSFKPDAQLCEIKLFHHDPEEELGHDANMVRDVSDINSEGRMFKQHKEMMDIDDEDDEPTEKTFFDYKRPVAIDLSTIDKDTSDRGFEKTGGSQKAESPERTIQDMHVANTIMVHYFTRADIPLCPKEPFDPYNGVRQDLQIGGQPAPDSIYSQRAKAMAPVMAPVSAPSIDINAILQGLTPMAMQAPSMQPQMATPFAAQPQPQPAADNSLAAIQNILAQFAQPAAQAQQPAQPQWQMPTPQSAAPMSAQQPAVPSGVDAFLASLQQGPGPAAAPAMPPPATQTAEQAAANAQWAAMYPNTAWGQAPTANTGAPDAAALLAMFSGNNNAAPTPYGNYGGYNQQQNDNMYGADADYNDRKRGHDDNDEYDQRGGKFQKNGVNRKKDWDMPEHSNKPRFVVQCKFYKEGKCRKGAECTFRHD